MMKLQAEHGNRTKVCAPLSCRRTAPTRAFCCWAATAGSWHRWTSASLVLHGKHGEDGTIQGLFQLADIPFVGCDAISSANCMDKEMTHTILEAHGIQMAKWLRVDNEKMQDFDAFAKQAEQKLGYPMFVKPANAGSSVGVGKAHDRAELKSACLHALQEDYKAVVEECIEMQEVETAVLGNSNPQAAGVVGELVPVVEFYTYEAKYIDGTTALHIPGRVDEEISQQLRRTAEKAFAAIGCQGFARIDFFVRKGDQCGDPQRNQHHPGLYLHQHVPEAVGTLRAFLSAAAGPPDSAGTGAQRTITKPKEGTRRLWITGQSGCLIRDWGA